MVRDLDHRSALMAPAIPIATYRLQLTPSFSFDDAAKTVPYLKALGISHLYASPFLKARSGSTHGYDIIDHNALNPEFGGEDAFLPLSAALSQADIGLILDFVPNHMGVHYADNEWWLDVLEWGPKSPYAGFFDIDWQTLPARPQGGVLIPILGRPYGEALESGEIELRYDPAEGSFSAWYYEHKLPIGPNRYGEMLEKIVAAARASEEIPGRWLLEVAAGYRGPHNPTRERAPGLKAEIAAIAGSQEVIERGIKVYQPKSDEPGALLALHHLLERQHYRAAHWRLAGSDINYRRFFDINSLAGLRVEDKNTFQALHRLVARLIQDGRLQGLRLDHIDGLRDPHQYLRRLTALIQARRPPDRPDLYLVIEKILGEGEHLPRFAGVSGTTGYEWLNVISRVLVDERGIDTLDQIWREASGENRNFEDVLIEAKGRVLDSSLASEFTVLSHLLARIATGHYSSRDFSASRLRAAFRSFILHFQVYRTYITGSGPSAADRKTIEIAIDKARGEWFGPDIAIFDFLRDTLTLDLIAPGRVGHSIVRVRRFARKVQQFTGPMMAKSLEDTAFYRFHRLLALNEVGGSPDARGLSVEGFHRLMQSRGKTFPHGLTATATHDTKRGEDARARLLALSELADEWGQAAAHWRNLNSRLIASEGAPGPYPAHEYMLYQALLGAWPLEGVDRTFIERVQAYAVKAAREGKQQTSWLAPDEPYEKGLMDFISRILDRAQSADFIAAFDAFARRTALIGALNSLSQLVLKTTMPGVPDYYQGTEFWDLSFVDPDNRRPVDFAARAAGLTSLADPDWQSLVENWSDGQIKFALLSRLLAIRQQFATVFTDGAYYPLTVEGRDRDEVVAFTRTSGSRAVIVVVGRLFARATERGRQWPSDDAWQATIRVDGFSSVRNALGPAEPLSGSELPASALFHPLPVAVLQADWAQSRTKRKSTKDRDRPIPVDA
jgi:(1->4)-alpha-D-glucan 1-alpha-D-glucosylmutase